MDPMGDKLPILMEACVIRMTETCCKSSNLSVPVLVGLNMFELRVSPRAWLLTAPGSFLLYPLCCESLGIQVPFRSKNQTPQTFVGIFHGLN